jgi:RNase P/RNase MRP subunit POP5
MKERRRYILFKIVKENQIAFNEQVFLKILWKTIWKYFGLKVANKIGLWLIELNLEKNYGIIRCAHQTKEEIITVLTMMRCISDSRIVLSPVKTSGTIKTIKDYINEFSW